MRKFSGERMHAYLQCTYDLPELNSQTTDTKEVLYKHMALFQVCFLNGFFFFSSFFLPCSGNPFIPHLAEDVKLFCQGN